MMTKNEMIKYMTKELSCLKEEYEKIQSEYNKADHMDRIGMCHRLDKAQDMYYQVWMLCNDMGIIDPRA